jgi:uncharacterized protein
MPQLSREASDFSWLVGNFANRTPEVAHAMVVSADGLPVAVSDRLDRPKPTSSPPSPPGWPA